MLFVKQLVPSASVQQAQRNTDWQLLKADWHFEAGTLAASD